MNKKKTFTTIAIISTIGIICWIITGYFGGMFIHLLSYGLIIIPIIILYIISIFDTFISTARQGFKANKIKLIFHGLVLFAIVLTNLYQSDVLKSKSSIRLLLPVSIPDKIVCRSLDQVPKKPTRRISSQSIEPFVLNSRTASDSIKLEFAFSRSLSSLSVLLAKNF